MSLSVCQLSDRLKDSSESTHMKVLHDRIDIAITCELVGARIELVKN